MSYTALYRKWRPVRFDDVYGQDHIVQTLKNQIISQRIVTPICSAEREEPERLRLQRFFRELSTVNIRSREAGATSVRLAGVF